MRVTSGDYKNRRLSIAKGSDIRPTSDRMRQSIFNVLRHSQWENFGLGGAYVLDLFCGSGAMGIEALSQGAKYCFFIDKDIKSIKENSHFLQEGTFEILQSDATKIRAGQEKVNLVFMDPPYKNGLVDKALQNLLHQNWLANDAIIVVESEKNLKINSDLVCIDSRVQSNSRIDIFRYEASIK